MHMCVQLKTTQKRWVLAAASESDSAAPSQACESSSAAHHSCSSSSLHFIISDLMPKAPTGRFRYIIVGRGTRIGFLSTRHNHKNIF